MNETCKQLVYRFLDELKRTYYTTSSICHSHIVIISQFSCDIARQKKD